MSEKHHKVKVITFNTHNHLENFLYECAHGMKGSQSFSGLMKQLFVAYLTSTGTPPPGSFVMEIDRPVRKEKVKKRENTI